MNLTRLEQIAAGADITPFTRKEASLKAAIKKGIEEPSDGGGGGGSPADAYDAIIKTDIDATDVDNITGTATVLKGVFEDLAAASLTNGEPVSFFVFANLTTASGVCNVVGPVNYAVYDNGGEPQIEIIAQATLYETNAVHGISLSLSYVLIWDSNGIAAEDIYVT